MVDTPQQSTKTFFRLLGFSHEWIAIYQLLNERGPLSTLEISRQTGVPRSTLYRKLLEMQTRGLVEEVVEEYRSAWAAADPHVLAHLVEERAVRQRQLEHSLPSTLDLLQQEQLAASQPTQVKYYKGKRGITQMVWNVLNAQTELVGFSYRRIEEVLGFELSQEFHDEFAQRDLKMRDIVSDTFLQSVQSADRSLEWSQDHFITRYVPPSVITIDCQTDIYNDVFATYSWHNGELFGVEIYNPTVANLQRQLFEVVWQQAKPAPAGV